MWLSGLFHVGGGALALIEAHDATETNGAGGFAAPGVLGLALGGALAASGHLDRWHFGLVGAALSLR